MQQGLIGGWSKTMPATPETQEICDMVRKELEEKYRKFSKYIATKYRDQSIEGKKYLVKIEVDKGEYVHVKIFLPPTPDGKAEFLSYEPHHTADDPIEPF